MDTIANLTTQISALTTQVSKLTSTYSFNTNQVAFCELYPGPHSTLECMSGNPSASPNGEQVNFVNNFQWDNQGPYSNTYNPGWRNHPNFSWRNENNALKPPPGFQKQGPARNAPPQQRSLPSNTEENPKGVNAIMLRSGKELDTVNRKAQIEEESPEKDKGKQKVEELRQKSLGVKPKLGLGECKETHITLQLADGSIKYPKGIVENVLVKVDKFIFPGDGGGQRGAHDPWQTVPCDG
ncbi:hypothetical protein CRG98_003627 [Punica granatum]|uniref:Uncharacterized protein n=1 Tax=Punica granatum TaxID=22663 RepID=A0A2I0L5H4_PUNGR|nr:hypothetical protein CRG98_003627 [Punica granatum]